MHASRCTYLPEFLRFTLSSINFNTEKLTYFQKYKVHTYTQLDVEAPHPLRSRSVDRHPTSGPLGWDLTPPLGPSHEGHRKTSGGAPIRERLLTCLDGTSCPNPAPSLCLSAHILPEKKREGDPNGWSKVLITALGSWQKSVPAAIEERKKETLKGGLHGANHCTAQLRATGPPRPFYLNTRLTTD
jgi:hypothetical protein